MPNPAFSLVIDHETADTTPISVRIGQTHITRMGVDGTSVSSKSFLTALKNDLAPQVGLLPPGVRFVTPSKKLWLFERAPETITIDYGNDILENISDETTRMAYTIRLPWLAYLVDLDQTYYPDSIFVYALRHSICSASDQLGVLPLSNFSTGGKLCQPHRSLVEDVPTTIGEGLQLAYQMVWSSGFNRDLDANFAWCRGLKKPYSIFKKPEYEDTSGVYNISYKFTEHWESMTDEEIENIEDWPPPRHYDRFLSGEDAQEMRDQGDIMRQGNPNYYRTIGEILETANINDLQRYGDWDSVSLQRLFQSAMSQAGLYE